MIAVVIDSLEAVNTPFLIIAATETIFRDSKMFAFLFKL